MDKGRRSHRHLIGSGVLVLRRRCAGGRIGDQIGVGTNVEVGEIRAGIGVKVPIRYLRLRARRRPQRSPRTNTAARSNTKVTAHTSAPNAQEALASSQKALGTLKTINQCSSTRGSLTHTRKKKTPTLNRKQQKRSIQPHPPTLAHRDGSVACASGFRPHPSSRNPSSTQQSRARHPKSRSRNRGSHSTAGAYAGGGAAAENPPYQYQRYKQAGVSLGCYRCGCSHFPPPSPTWSSIQTRNLWERERGGHRHCMDGHPWRRHWHAKSWNPSNPYCSLTTSLLLNRLIHRAPRYMRADTHPPSPF